MDQGLKVKLVKTFLPPNQESDPQDGNKTLNMPCSQWPMDSQPWPTNHNTGS